jgi:hypothetical protein
MLRGRGDTGSYPKKNAGAKWIFSRGGALLLATTATTSEMPGGMKRLTHRNEYTYVSRKVKKTGNREQGIGNREQGIGNRE